MKGKIKTVIGNIFSLTRYTWLVRWFMCRYTCYS